MRLHRLVATAFGPFADTVELDLEELSAAGLYLIHGPTGSGKTSLLDAICFALYANVPGDRLTTSLRSQHAAGSTITQVELEVTLAGRRLRITRNPAYERPKKRGTGTTTQPARVQLDEYLGGDWQALSSRNDETAQVLDDLLGMGLDQFRRVVMLPQGDFAAFLRATDEERREVLERLFDVTDYVAVEEHLTVQRQQAQSLLATATATLEGHVGRLTELLAETDAELPTAQVPLDHLQPPQLREAVAAIDTALDAQASELMVRVDTARGQATSTRTALESGRRVEERRHRGRRAQQVLELLAQSADEHADRRDRLARAREAAVVQPHIMALERAEVALTTAERAREAALTKVTCRADEDLTAVRSRLLDHAELLTTAHHESQRLTRIARDLARSDDMVTQSGELVTAALDAAATARTRAEKLEEGRAEIDLAEQRMAALTPLFTQLSELVEARSSVRDLEDRARTTTDRRQVAQAEVLSRRERVQQLVQQRLDTMAGELARQLVDGQACAVCGSVEHPAPAPATDQVTPQQIAQARTDVAAAETELDLARTLDENTATELQLARATVEGHVHSVAELAHDLDGRELDATGDLDDHRAALEDERAALVEVAGRGPDIVKAIEACAVEVTRAETTHAKAVTAVTEARARHEQLRSERDDCLRRLDEALRGHHDACSCREVLVHSEETISPENDGGFEERPETAQSLVQAAVDTHRRALAGLEEALEATAGLERARLRREEALEHVSSALAESVFEVVDEVVAAALSRTNLERLEQTVDDYEVRRATATATCEEDDVVAALQADELDLDALNAAAEDTRSAAEIMTRRQASAETVRSQFLTLRDHVLRACADLEPATEQAAVVTNLAALVTGTSSDNAKRMRLSTYVLAARLERIVELANERLIAMADGRYELGHNDSGARGQRRGGLGLLVRDLWTGQVRPTSSLSGGESFTTSLALALGLADAIREESGGQEFGTLFVDEGFGSLDEDSLEQVMDVLDRLRDGGRTVGVVSHVAEMRTRIPTQVRVRKTQHGSSISVVTTGTADVA